MLVEGGRLVLTVLGGAGEQRVDRPRGAGRCARCSPAVARAPSALLQPSNLEALLQGAGFEQIEVGRVGRPDALPGGRRAVALGGGVPGVGAACSGRLPESDRERVQDALARALAGRQRGGEATVGREIVFARAIAPPSP